MDTEDRDTIIAINDEIRMWRNRYLGKADSDLECKLHDCFLSIPSKTMVNDGVEESYRGVVKFLLYNLKE